MKWIGQHIWDFISRFRSDVYLEKGADLYITDSADAGDYCSIATTTHGATTLTTVDDDATAAHFEIAADGDITLDSAGDVAIEAAGDIHLEAIGNDITVDTNKFTITTSDNINPYFELINTHSGAGNIVGGMLNFVANREAGSPGVNGDGLGYVRWMGDNDAEEQIEFAKWTCKALEVDDGNEAGEINFDLANFDGDTGTGFSLTGSTTTNNTINATIGLGSTSVVTIPGRVIARQYRIINASFRDDIGTTKHYVPLKSQAEQTVLTREEGTELAICDGRLVSATVRVENMQGTTGDFTLTMGVETNVVGAAYANFGGTAETEVITVNTDDDNHVFHFVFNTAKHWDATDMFAVSIESSSDEWGSNERFFVTLVIEDNWNTYLGGVAEGVSSSEIDTTP
jgi:hypothetical protein